MKNIICILILILVVSCQSNSLKRPKKPDNLIHKDQMVEVLYDMALLTSSKGTNRKLIENSGIKPNVFIYTKHNIDSLQFALSNAYYAFDIKEYQDIYDRVKEKFQEDKVHFKGLVDLETKKKDSIKKRNKRIKDSLRKAKDTSKLKVNPKSPSLLKKDEKSL